jgi:hypothetical protein
MAFKIKAPSLRGIRGHSAKSDPISTGWAKRHFSLASSKLFGPFAFEKCIYVRQDRVRTPVTISDAHRDPRQQPSLRVWILFRSPEAQ